MNDTEIWAFLSSHLHTSCKKNHKRNRIDYKKYKAQDRENRRLTRNSDRDSHGVRVCHRQKNRRERNRDGEHNFLIHPPPPPIIGQIGP